MEVSVHSLSVVCVCVSPGDVGNGLYDGVAERVASDLQHAPRDEQEEQEGAAHSHDQVHPHALPAEDRINRASVRTAASFVEAVENVEMGD